MSLESDPGHGSSPAAWTAVVVMLLAFTIGTIAFFLDAAWLVWASVGLLVFGGVLGLLLARLGYGVNGPRYVPKKAHY